MRTHARQEQRILNLHSSEPSDVSKAVGLIIYLFGQCRCWGIQHNILYTSPFLWFAGTGSLGCTSSCCRVVKGWKVTWMTRGVRPSKWIWTIYWCRGESQITGLTVMWSLLVRLRAGVLVCGPLGIPISQESLRHQFLFLRTWWEGFNSAHQCHYNCSFVGWCEWRHRYWSVWVALRCTVGWRLIVFSHYVRHYLRQWESYGCTMYFLLVDSLFGHAYITPWIVAHLLD